MRNIKTYSELSELKTFEERFEYLKIGGAVGRETFGYLRYLNQVFYHSEEYLSFRDYVIRRDMGCDMGLSGYDIIEEPIYVHHINPITPEDILNRNFCLLDPNNAVCVRFSTHNAIHYGDSDLLQIYGLIERSPNDTCPWKR